MVANGRRTHGIALITSLAILVIVGTLVLGTILTTQVELSLTRNDSTSTQAQYIAQAGLQKYKAVLFQNFQWIEGGNTAGSTNLDACTNSLESGIDFDRDATLDENEVWVDDRIAIASEPVTSATGTTIGTYSVEYLRDPGNRSRITVRSVGRTTAGDASRRATATVTGTYFIRNSSTLEQAIFAGQGSDMRFVNGNTTVYGGVYIVGDRDDSSTVVIESNGDFGIFNGYDKTGDASNAAYLDAEVRASNNLCAALRVESGTVAVGGSTQLGKPDNKLLTVAVSNGSEDISLDRGGTENCLQNKGICTEVGPKPFDLDTPPDFPDLDDVLSTDLCPSGTWRDCIRSEAADDGMIFDTGGNESVDFTSGTVANVAQSCKDTLDAAAASSDDTLTFGTASIDCSYTDDTGVTHGFVYDTTTAPAVFEAYGNLNFRGLNLELTQDTVYQARSRTSSGATNTYAALSIETVDTDGTPEDESGDQGGTLTALGNFAADQNQGKFPSVVLSIVAERDVDFAEEQGIYTAPVYAERQFRLRGSAELFGQVFSNQFCTSAQSGSCGIAGVPGEIVYVPLGAQRPASFRAIAPTGGIPTFETVGYELR